MSTLKSTAIYHQQDHVATLGNQMDITETDMFFPVYQDLVMQGNLLTQPRIKTGSCVVVVVIDLNVSLVLLLCIYAHPQNLRSTATNTLSHTKLHSAFPSCIPLIFFYSSLPLECPFTQLLFLSCCNVLKTRISSLA